MAIVVGVRFRTAGKIYDFSPEGETYAKGEHVIVETARGVECGEVQNGNHEVPDNQVVAPLKAVQRRATPEDVARNEENRRREKEARDICQERIRRHKLEMKLIDVEYTFDNSKILFYFTADGRVDFRDLVKDLASVFRTRIELRQIGVRDEAKMMGAIGTCGRELCCSTFLSEFHPVSIKMAKEQSLSLNPTKISGTCGRLMCCLKYENEAYEYLHKRCPKPDAVVKTPQGQGTVVHVSLLREMVKVRLDTETGNDLIEVKVDDLEIIRDGGKRHCGECPKGGPAGAAAEGGRKEAPGRAAGEGRRERGRDGGEGRRDRGAEGGEGRRDRNAEGGEGAEARRDRAPEGGEGGESGEGRRSRDRGRRDRNRNREDRGQEGAGAESQRESQGDADRGQQAETARGQREDRRERRDRRDRGIRDSQGNRGEGADARPDERSPQSAAGSAGRAHAPGMPTESGDALPPSEPPSYDRDAARTVAAIDWNDAVIEEPFDDTPAQPDQGQGGPRADAATHAGDA